MLFPEKGTSIQFLSDLLDRLTLQQCDVGGRMPLLHFRRDADSLVSGIGNDQSVLCFSTTPRKWSSPSWSRKLMLSPDIHTS